MLIPAQNHALEERVFKIANQIALEQSLKLHYSSFHVWEHLSQFNQVEALGEPAEKAWGKIEPFGHCVTQASIVTSLLRKALYNVPDLVHYAPRVNLCVRQTSLIVTSERQFHALTLIHFKDHCILIDLTGTPCAVKIPLESQVRLDDTLDFNGTTYATWEYKYWVCNYERRFSAVCYDKEGNVDMLAPQAKPFTPVSQRYGICELSFPACKTVNDKTGLPSNKTIMVRSSVPFEIPGLPCTYFATRKVYVVDVLIVKISFGQGCLGFQVPYESWARHNANKALMDRLDKFDGIDANPILGEGNVVGVFYVNLLPLEMRAHDSHGILEKLRIADEICAGLGMPQGEVVRIAEVVLKIRREAREAKRLKEIDEMMGEFTVGEDH